MSDELAANETCEDLKIMWEGGEETVLPASYLRKQARDAWSIRERIDHGDIHVMPGIQITGIYQVGAAGVNLHFSDGHERAIYPFDYLRELSESFDN